MRKKASRHQGIKASRHQAEEEQREVIHMDGQDLQDRNLMKKRNTKK